jgi:hypothetical protein
LVAVFGDKKIIVTGVTAGKSVEKPTKARQQADRRPARR